MALVRKPNHDDRVAAAATTRPSPEYAANRIRRTFLDDIDSSKARASRIHKAVTRQGRAAVEAALGVDGPELAACYAALKTYIETLDTSYTVPDLPA